MTILLAKNWPRVRCWHFALRNHPIVDVREFITTVSRTPRATVEPLRDKVNQSWKSLHYFSIIAILALKLSTCALILEQWLTLMIFITSAISAFSLERFDTLTSRKFVRMSVAMYHRPLHILKPACDRCVCFCKSREHEGSFLRGIVAHFVSTIHCNGRQLFQEQCQRLNCSMSGLRTCGHGCLYCALCQHQLDLLSRLGVGST